MGAEVGGVQTQVGDKTKRLGVQNCENTLIKAIYLKLAAENSEGWRLIKR